MGNNVLGKEPDEYPFSTVRNKVRQIYKEIASNRSSNIEAPEKISEEITNSLVETWGKDKSAEIAKHMTEWLEEAAFMVALTLFPEKFTKEEKEAGIILFLHEAPDHIAAAATLIGVPIEDTFDVGVCDHVKEK